MAQITALADRVFYGGKGLTDDGGALVAHLQAIVAQGNQTETAVGAEADEVTTTDATITTIKTITPAVSSIILLEALIVGVRTDVADQAVAYRHIAAFKKSAAGTVTAVGNSLEPIHEEEVALAAADVTMAASGATVLVRVTGIAGATIKWKAIVRQVTESIA